MLSLYLISVSIAGALIAFYRMTYRKFMGATKIGYFSSCLTISAPFTFALWLFLEVGIDRMTVPSSSMLPSINIGDSFFVNKTAFNANYIINKTSHTHPETGDVVVMKFPINTDVHYVKVFIAKEGQTVVLSQVGIQVDNHLYPFTLSKTKQEYQVSKNKSALLDEYSIILNGHEHTFLKKAGEQIQSMNLVVPKGGMFVLGTNLDYSGDSRQMGAISESLLVGLRI
ncbi:MULTISPECIES: signal peptidase I [Vibrio]|uniref:signal peptidase I n=1 Tax=Vibrio TaxID=662 RepID=UPI00078C1F3A|nr:MULTISPECIES: signal peptidase I [Vibrio]BAU70859.1 hypothetical protein [Vibrio sp. 04Ya108]BBM67572.1 hypothetical protein VA249_42180 [Vibrio alfacsensis]BCN27055.1 hypothetical protein VYA_42470 [Vibrio alfacsensis]